MEREAVKFDDLLEAFEFVSAGQPFENEAYLCIETVFLVLDFYGAGARGVIRIREGKIAEVKEYFDTQLASLVFGSD
jgi:hypothetical protein